MSVFGLTDQGFVIKTFPDIIADMAAAMKNAFGASFASDDPQSVIGQVEGSVGQRISLCWEGLQALYASQGPDGSTGQALDQVSAITGTLREGARGSTALLILFGNFGTLVPAGSAVSDGLGALFDVDTDTPISNLITSWGAATMYAQGAVVSHDSGKLYICTTAGTSAGSGGPTGTGSAIADGSCVWFYAATASYAAASALTSATAEITGPTAMDAGELVTIETPIAGWSAVVNPFDAALGADRETDPEMRIRREEELAPGGAGTPEAIRSALRRVGEGTNNPVTAVKVFYNETETIDADGLAAHAVHALVLGGTNAAIAAALFATVDAGTLTVGATSVNVTDSEGISRPINFDRPTEVAIYVTITLTYDAALYPADGDTEIKDAIKANGDAYPIGLDVTASKQSAQAFKVPGVLDVSDVKIGTAPSPGSSATITITKFQIATFDTAHIVVNSSAGSP